MAQMIEFKGNFYHKSETTPVPVLIQFDGMLLHAWHVTDPFYRIFSNDIFQITCSTRSNTCSIKLPAGSRLETDNYQAIKLIEKHQKNQTSKSKTFARFHDHRMIAATLLAVFSIAWLLVAMAHHCNEIP